MNTKTLQILTLASGLLLLNACGGGSKSTTPDVNTSQPDVNTSVPVATSITHNGTTYGFVTSPHTTRIWLDKNLGAAEVCAGFDDVQCYGDYYQWGRDHDGHQESDSRAAVAQANNVTEVGHGDFIKSIDMNNYDWAEDVDGSGGRRAANWSATDGSSVCPTGFRVPTENELTAETTEATSKEGSTKITSNTTAFTNFLKLPSSGSRNSTSTLVTSMGSWGFVWASSVKDSNSYGVRFGSANDSASLINVGRGFGFSVRCIKN